MQILKKSVISNKREAFFMKRRALSVVLSAATLVSLAACGSYNTPTTTTAAPAATTAAAAETTAAAAEAKAVLANKTVTQGDVAEAQKNLSEAIENLKLAEKPEEPITPTVPTVEGVTRLAGAGRIDTGLAVADTLNISPYFLIVFVCRL